MSSVNKKPSKLDVAEWKSPRLVEHDANGVPLSPDGTDMRQQIYEEAFKEGYENGRELGRQEARDQLEILRNMVEGLRKPYDEQSQRLAENIAQLAGKIARAVVSAELKTNPQMLTAMVRQTLDALNSEDQDVAIHLNPKNAHVVRELIRAETGGQTWKIVDDTHVPLDACKVRCDDSVIDADLETRVNLVVSQFLDRESGGDKQ